MKKITLYIGLCLFLPNLKGQVNSICFNAANNINSPVLSNPFSLITNDFNLDGKKDLAVANFGSNNITVYFGNGLGTYSSTVNYAVGSGPRSICIGDYNNDGNTDLGVLNINSNNVSILIGSSSGTFASAVNYTVGINPRSIVCNDFNSDGKSDLAITNGGSNNVSILLGSGTGTFSSAINSPASGTPQGIAAADFNGDGQIDLALANTGSGNLSVLIGLGTGSFASAMNFTAGNLPHFVSTNDFNTDGKLDLVVANYNSNNVSVLFGTGTGSFSSANNYAAGGNPQGVISADFNTDGISDLAVPNGGSGTISFLRGSISGTFASAVNYNVGSNPITLSAVDLNLDGKLDLAVANYNSNNLSILINALPTLTISSNNNVCSGYSISLSASGASTYTWSNLLNTSSIVVNPTITSAYSVTGTSSLGCIASAVKTIVVNSLPIITVNNGSICSGQTFTFNPSGASSYTVTGGSFTVSPLSNTSYSITGTNSLGCLSPSPGISAITVGTVPIVSIMGPPPFMTSCPGQTVVLFGSGANTYTWSTLTGTFSNNPNLSVSPTVSTTYTLIGRSAAGCISLPASSLITVSANPTITVNHPTICAGQSAVLSPTGGVSYSVFPFMAFTNTISIVPMFGNFTYSVIGQSINGCTASTTSSVIVNLPPIITVNSPSLCKYNSSDAATLTANGATTYTWSSGGNGATTFVVPSPTLQTYTVTGASNGCTAVAVSTVLSEDFTLINSSSWNLCASGPTTFTAHFVTLQSYTWSTGATTPTMNINLPSTNTVISYSGRGIACGYGFTWYINPLPLRSNTLWIAGNSNVCQGSAVTLSANLGAWSGGGSVLAWNTGASNGSINISPTVSSVYSASVITYSNTIGLSSASPTLGCINTGSFALTVNPIPTISVSAASSVICRNQTLSINGLGANSYSWNPGALTGTSIVISPSVNTSYSVVGSSSAGCLSNNTAVTTITVNPLPIITANSGSICNGSSFTINPSGASSYSITGGNFTVSPTTTNSYTILGTSSLGCVSDLAAISNITVYALPIISVNSGSICNGQSFTISPSGASTYTIQGGTAIKTPIINSSYTVSGTSTAGCVSALAAVSNVTVNSIPVISVNSGSICNGQSFTISPTGASTYTYSGGSAIVSPTTNTNYSVSGTSSAGCVSALAAVANVTVNSIPVISVNSGTICNGQSFTISPSGASTYTYSSGTAVVSPTTNTNYSVSGTSTAGCVSALAAVSNVTVNSIPVISVNSGSICNGQSFTISPTGANTYTIQGGTAIKTPSVNSSYTVSGTSSAGCLSALAAVSNVTVNSIPVISVNSGSICNGQSFTMSPSGASTYTYSGGSAIVSPTTSSNYSVSGTSSAGCVSAIAAVSNVTVNSIPVISVNSGSICNGQSFTMSPSGASTYTYSGGSAIVSPNTNTNYSVIGTSSAGCVSAIAAVSNVTVNSIPVISVNSGSICNGQSFTISPTGASTYTYSGGSAVVSPTTNTNYSVSGTSSAGCVSAIAAVSNVTVNSIPVISVNSGSICNGQSFTISPSGASTYTYSGGSAVVSPTTNTNYSVSGTSSAGCVSAIAAVSNVTVNSIPVISVNSGSICNGQSFTLSPSGASTYTYSGGSAVVSPSTNTIYSVSGTSSAGCASVIDAISNITVFTLPSISVNSGSICSGQSFTLSPSGASTYTYSGGSAIVSPTTSSNYSVSGTSSAGCVSASAAISSITVFALPQLTITSTNNTICAGESATLQASGANTYSWSQSSNLSSIVISPSLSSTYSLSGSNTNGCENKTTFTQSVDACVGVENYLKETSGLLVYPNPNNGEFIIETSKEITISILNVVGQVVKEVQMEQGKNQIELRNEAKGIYFIRMNDLSADRVIKIIKN